MRKVLITLAATLVATASAYAANLQGVVTEIDHDARTVALDGGESMKVIETADESSIEVGDNVTVVTDDATGEVTEIMVAE